LAAWLFVFADLSLASPSVAALTPEAWLAWEEESPEEAKAWLDSLPADSNQPTWAPDAAFLIQVANVLENRGEYAAELIWAREALRRLDNERPSAIRADALNAVGLGAWGVGEFGTAIDAYVEALDWFTQAQVWERAGDVSSNLGGVFHDLGELDLAMEYYQQGLEYLRRSGDDAEAEGDVLGNLALLWQHLGNVEKADALENEALALRETNEDWRGVAISLNNRGHRALEAGERNAAAADFARSRGIIESLGDETMLAGMLTQIARLAALESAWTEARQLMARSRELYAETGAAVEEASFRAGFAKTLAALPGQEQWALEVLTDSLATMESAGRSEELLDLYEVEIGLLRRLGREAEAWKVYEKRREMSEALAKERMRSRSQYLNTVFEVAEKDRLLQTEALARSEAERGILEAQHSRNLAIGGGGVMVMVLLLVLWRFVSVRRAHALIAHQHAELTRLTADKDLFMRIASHDLKTPLAGIRLSMGLLRHQTVDTLDSASRGLIEDAEAAAGRSLELVSAFLETQTDHVTNVERLPIVGVRPFLEEVVVEALPLATSRKIDVTVTASEDLAWPMDRLRLGRVLANLLSNALKFSAEATSVTLVAEARNDVLHLEVIDEGPGLKAHQVELEEVASRSGIGSHQQGLALVREFVRAMNGHFSLHERTDARGARAVVELPSGKSQH
jgi:signal transduction histidine kinase